MVSETESSQVACAVDNAHNLRAAFGNAVKSKPTLDDDRPRLPAGEFQGGHGQVADVP